ncbi:MAG: hypothetical protein V2I45_05185 [Halieaceae bacterium]|jgi:Flp pilus assembly protein TadD|nr:hypothetical protein [Halieaceae bacterium]
MNLTLKTSVSAAMLIAANLATAHPAAGNDPETPSSGYQLAVIEDGAYGPAVVKGNIAETLPRLRLHSNTRFDSSTNLCVALTQLGELNDANTACVTAYQLSKQSQFSRDRAIALSNLGVVSVLRGDFISAKGYFERALKENGQFKQAYNNLRLLEHRGATNA